MIMKKLLLLCTVVWAGHLYGMEPLHSESSYKTLPPELRQEIINKALAVSEDYKDAIDMIKKLSILHGVELDKLNLKDFTKWAHILANRFGVSTAQVAREFKTPIAQQYNDLGLELFETSHYAAIRIIHQDVLSTINKLIDQGSDPNFSRYCSSSILLNIIEEILSARPQDKEKLKVALIFLLKNGANPNAIIDTSDIAGPITVIDKLKNNQLKWPRSYEEREELLELLKPYMEQQK